MQTVSFNNLAKIKRTGEYALHTASSFKEKAQDKIQKERGLRRSNVPSKNKSQEKKNNTSTGVFEDEDIEKLVALSKSKNPN